MFTGGGGGGGAGNSKGTRRGMESNVIIMEVEYMDFQEMKNAVHPLQCYSSGRKKSFGAATDLCGSTQVLVSKTRWHRSG